jgi:hypothetical protein
MMQPIFIEYKRSDEIQRRSSARRLSFASRGHLLAAGVWVHLSSGSCKVSAIESWLSEPQPRMGFSQISETTERIQLIRVPEPASQVPISVVSDICKANVGCGSENPSKLGSSLALHSISDDIFSRNFSPCIFDENVGFTSALFAYPRKKSLKQAWLCIRFARHLDQSPFSAAAQHSSNKFDFAFALHENPDDINSPEIRGKWGPVRQRGSVPTIFKGGAVSCRRHSLRWGICWHSPWCL